MDLQSLRVFSSIAHRGSFTKGAKDLLMAQSNASSIIRNLERELQIRLFIRSKQGVKITAEGKMLLQKSDQIISLCDEMLDYYKQDRQNILKIACMESFSITHVLDHTANYVKKFANTQINLITCNTQLQYEKLRDGEVDCIFPAELITNSDIDHFPMAQDRLVLVEPKLDAIFSKRQFLALHPGCTFRNFSDLYIQESKQNYRTHTMPNIHSLYASLIGGMGCAILPKSFLDYHKSTAGHLNIRRLSKKYSITYFCCFRKFDGIRTDISQWIGFLKQ